MRRVVDWPERLLSTVAFWDALPFAWGRTDCLGFALACIKAVRGSPIVSDLPAYADAKEARRVLRDLGARELENAFMMYLDPVPVSLAQRGDVGILVQPGGIQSAVVCVGPTWAGKTEDGLVHIAPAQVSRAFRV
jgi:hypothetical protein